jgi:cyclin K
VFLATKTEENSRKLKDVSYVCYSKATGGTDEGSPVRPDSGFLQIAHLSYQEVQRWQKNILATEEILLDALCFDFIVDHPQAELVDLLAAFNAAEILEQYAWTLVNDSLVCHSCSGALSPLDGLIISTTSLRTPLCILQPPRIIATACFILGQKLEEGSNSASLDERIYSRSSASLPTPPHMHPRSPPSANFAQGFYQLSESEMEAVASMHFPPIPL